MLCALVGREFNARGSEATYMMPGDAFMALRVELREAMVA
jgi:hypothetical protein